MSIYRHALIAELQDWYGELLWPRQEQYLVDYLALLSDHLFKGLCKKHSSAYLLVNNYHPDHLGKRAEELGKINWSLPDAYRTIACEHGFKNWTAVEAMQKTRFDPSWQVALYYLLNGKIEALNQQLQRFPELVSSRSVFGHQATLLHYTAANGVEARRQQVPLNLPGLVRLLLANGADPHANIQVYGGHFDLLALLTSSAHPQEAGVLDETVRVIRSIAPGSDGVVS